MSFDLSVLDRLTQKFQREGSSLFIRTFDGTVLVDEFEFKNAPPGPRTRRGVQHREAAHLCRV